MFQSSGYNSKKYILLCIVVTNTWPTCAVLFTCNIVIICILMLCIHCDDNEYNSEGSVNNNCNDIV